MNSISFENINYDSIKYFISVAETGSLSKAAYSLRISQSALSQSMKNLEDSLGVKLFNRNTRGIILTPEGISFYEEVKVGNDYFENAIIQMTRMKKFDFSKTFRISVTGSLQTIILAPVMREILNKYPKINFEILTFSTEYNVVDKLQNSEIDLAIIKASDHFAAKEIVIKKLNEFHYYFTYNPDFFHFDKNTSYDDLKNYPIILKRRTGRVDNSWIKASFCHLIICHSDRSILEFIKNGAGIGVCAKEIAEKKGLKVIDCNDFPQTKRDIVACYLNPNPIAKDIVDILLQKN